MKIGDLVAYRGRGWGEWLGIIVKEIPGTADAKLVYWTDMSDGTAARDCHPEKELEVVSESR